MADENPTTPDVRVLFATRILRLFAYGFLSVVLVLYLAAAGLSEREIGLLLTLTLVGDTLISLWITLMTQSISCTSSPEVTAQFTSI